MGPLASRNPRALSTGLVASKEQEVSAALGRGMTHCVHSFSLGPLTQKTDNTCLWAYLTEDR